MSTETSYREWLQQDLGALVEALDLPELQKHFLRSRWLAQVLWMEGKANSVRAWYYVLRLTAIIGGVIVPALVSLKFSSAVALAIIGWITFVISLLVAISVAVEEFFHYGERWRHYRRTVEWLKSEGWQFFQLGGAYRRYRNHADAYPVFATRVETLLQQEVEVYITEVAQEREEEKPGTP